MSLENLAASDVISAARAWAGTPFRHQGRQRGVGVDCIGLIVAVMHELDYSQWDRLDYGRTPNDTKPNELELVLDMLFTRKTGDPVPGDILLFQARNLSFHFPQHVAIMTDKGMIHADRRRRLCVEHSFGDKWRRRFVRAYEWRH